MGQVGGIYEAHLTTAPNFIVLSLYALTNVFKTLFRRFRARTPYLYGVVERCIKKGGGSGGGGGNTDDTRPGNYLRLSTSKNINAQFSSSQY